MKIGWSTFKALDIFAPNIQMNICGQKTFKTFTGMWFALVHFGIMIAVVVSNFESFFDGQHPITIVENYDQKQYPAVNLNDNSYVPALVGYFTEVDFIPADQISSYFTVFIAKVTWTTSRDNGLVVVTKNISQFETMPCKNLTNDQLKGLDYAKTDPFYYDVIMNHGICPVTNSSFFVQGSLTSSEFDTITYYIKPCTLVSGCRLQEELIPVNIQFFMPDTRLNVTNKQDPTSLSLYGEDLYYFNFGAKQMYSSKLIHTTILDYAGLIPSYQMKTSYYGIGDKLSLQAYRDPAQLTCSFENAIAMDDGNCRSYIEFTIMTTGQFNVVKRVYRTLGDTFGAIGGTNGVLMIVLAAIYLPINDKKRTRFLMENVYSLIVKSENEKQSKGKDKDTKNLNEVYKNSSISKNCFCKKKEKSEDEQRYENNIRIARERIERSLDSSQIINNFNILKVISQFLFKNRHFAMAQVVGFDICSREKALSKLKAAMASSAFWGVGDNQQLTSTEELPNDKDRYKSLVEEIEREYKKEEDDPSFDPDTKKLDTFYHYHLSESVGWLLGLKDEAIKLTSSSKRGHLNRSSDNSPERTPDPLLNRGTEEFSNADAELCSKKVQFSAIGLQLPKRRKHDVDKKTE